MPPSNTGNFGSATGGISPALQRAMQGGGTVAQQPPLTDQVTPSAPTFDPATQSQGLAPTGAQTQPLGGSSSLPMPMNPQDTTIIIKALTNRINADTAIQKSSAKANNP